MNFINLTDGYKLDHRRQYPNGTEYVYSNFTPRSTRIPGATSVVFFGLQYFLAKYFMDKAQEFFDLGLRLTDGLTKKQEKFLSKDSVLQPVWENGKFLRTTTLDEIRARI